MRASARVESHVAPGTGGSAHRALDDGCQFRHNHPGAHQPPPKHTIGTGVEPLCRSMAAASAAAGDSPARSPA